MNILDTIAENTRQRYKEIIKNKPLAKVKAEALEMPKGNFEFEKALGGDTLSFICEVKKASPSKGVIAEDFPYLQIAKEYEAAGRGHKDFKIYEDPFLGTYKAAMRRDFTINAMMQDVLTGEIIDHFGGQEDLKKGVLRHVNPHTFAEDPLRVLRAAQFADRKSVV